VTETAQSRRAPTDRLGAAHVVVLLVVTSGLLYVVMYFAQRMIYAGPSGDGFAAGLGLYLGTVLGLFALYVGVLRLLRQRPLSRGLRIVAFGFPVVYSLCWLAVAPVFSSDVFAYIAHGYVSVELAGNPYLVGSSAVAASPLGPELLSYGWQPVHPATPYGPVLTKLETGIVALSGGEVRLSMLLFKLIAVASSLAVGAIIWMILRRVRPEDCDLGTVAYLWNPAVLLEISAEGHNDGIMTLLAVGAVLLVLSRRVVLGVLTLVVASLTKYVPMLLGPALLGYLWRSADDKRSLSLRIGAGALAGVFVVVALYAPYWAGRQTFSGLEASGRAGHTGSTETVLAEALSRVVSEGLAIRVLWVAATAAVVVAGVTIAMRVRTPTDLLRGCALLMVLYTILAPAYWPWYVVLPAAFLALVPRGAFLVLLVAMSLGSRLVAPLNLLYVDEVIGRPTFFLLTWAGAIGLPLLAALASSRTSFGVKLLGSSRRRYGTFEP
jgi:alpha-1,6-mannosyltransferase